VRRVAIAIVSACAAATSACEGNTTQREPIAAPLRPREADGARPRRASNSLTSRPALAVELSAPPRAQWDAGLAGAGARHVRITLTNTGDQAARVADLRVSFHAQRQGVAFPCAPHALGSMKDPEPSELAPGQRFTYERDIDCALAATGRYDIAAFVRFGAGDGAHDDPIGTFGFEVTGAGPYAPRPLLGRPAVQVALVGDAEPRERPPIAWANGDFKLTLLFVNTGAAPFTLGESRISLAAASKTGALDCLETRTGPFVVPPGGSYPVELPLACQLASRTEYEITARLAAEQDRSGGPEVGRHHLRVKSQDEPPLTPTPAPPL
jgi:hypothetical protein